MNTDIKWIKITTNMFDDEKIKMIEAIPEADMVLVIWVKLLTLAGRKNMNGYIFLTENIPYTDEMLSTLFNRPLNTVRLALSTFKKFDMIDYEDNGFMKITNWEKHQNIEGLDKIREQNRLRQEKYREKQKQLSPPCNPLLKEEKNKKRKDKNRIDSNVTNNVTNRNTNKSNTKDKYIECVYLSQDEYNKLIEKLGKTKTNGMIEDLNNYIMSKGKRYKSHYHTILNWDRMESKKGKKSMKDTLKEWTNDRKKV